MGSILDVNIVVIIVNCVLVASIFKYFVWKHDRSMNKNIIMMFSLFFYLLLLDIMFISPIRPFYDMDLEITSAMYWQLIPFKTILKMTADMTVFKRSIVCVLMFIPIPMYVSYFRKRVCRLFEGFLAGLLVSIVIEITQVSIDYLNKYPDRVFDVDEIMLNALGILIGWFIVKSYFIREPNGLE